MRRRDFAVYMAGLVAGPAASRAQQHPGKVRRIGYLGTGSGSSPATTHLLQVLRQGLRERGWVEGENIAMDLSFAEGRHDRLPALAHELLRRDVELIIATPTPAVQAAKTATRTTPIVAIGFDNPVENGLVQSLARPGGNVTGISYGTGPQIFGKDLELLRILKPDVQEIAVLSNAANVNHAFMLDSVTRAAAALGVSLHIVDARRPEDFDGVFADLTRARIDALFVFGDPMFGVHGEQLARLALQARIATIYTNRPHVEAGGLMSYGPSFEDIWRRSAMYVDKLLKGTNPADLPIEQPTKFELVINLRTAKALGLDIPLSLLARADEVME